MAQSSALRLFLRVLRLDAHCDLPACVVICIESLNPGLAGLLLCSLRPAGKQRFWKTPSRTHASMEGEGRAISPMSSLVDNQQTNLPRFSAPRNVCPSYISCSPLDAGCISPIAPPWPPPVPPGSVLHIELPSCGVPQPGKLEASHVRQRGEPSRRATSVIAFVRREECEYGRRFASGHASNGVL